MDRACFQEALGVKGNCTASNEMLQVVGDGGS